MSSPTRSPFPHRTAAALFFLPIVVLLEFSGCSTYHNVTAYFNTYYNARRLFDEAVGELRQQPAKDRDTNYFAAYTVPQNIQDKFDKVIEKCSKLIQFYPKSSYVDDAILMIGESYVYLGEYESGTRKFKELSDNFPTSDVRFDARLWDAKAKYLMKKNDEALAVIKDLFPDARAQGKNDILLEALMLQARIFSERGEFDQAASSWGLASEVSADDALRAMAEYQLGRSLEKLGDKAKAAEAYSKVRKFNPDPALDFDSRLRYGTMLAGTGQQRRALKLFDDMNEDPLTVEQHALVDYEIGNTYLAMGDTAQAFSLYNMVDTTYRRSDAAAKSYYRLGLVHEEDRLDYKSAREYYNKAKGESPNSEVTILAQRRAENLDHLFNTLDDLKRDREMYIIALHRDSAIAAGDTAGVRRIDMLSNARSAGRIVDTTAGRRLAGDISRRAFPVPDAVNDQLRRPGEESGRGSSETLRRRLTDRDQFPDEDEAGLAPGGPLPSAGAGSRYGGRDSLQGAAAASPSTPSVTLTADSVRSLLAQAHFELGGIYYLELKRPDSAMVWYESVVEEFPSTPFVPRALYAIAEIQSGRHNDRIVDSLYHVLLTRYGQSEYAAQVRKILGIETKQAQPDSAESQYREGENYLQAGKPTQALKVFKQIASSRKKSSFTPKATYAVGWLYETVLLNNDSAAQWYHHLTSRYPTSVYAAGVQPKIAVHDNPKSLKEYVKLKTIEPVSSQPPDSLGRPAAPRSAQTAADRIRQRQQEELNNRVNEDTPEEDDTQKDEDDQPDPDDNN